MKTDKLTLTLLYDLYGELLTGKQRDCFDLHYNQDYSLSEIAEEMGTSRQSVHDAVSRAEAQLLRLEEIAHGLENERRSAAIAAMLRAAAARLPQADPAEREAVAARLSEAADALTGKAAADF